MWKETRGMRGISSDERDGVKRYRPVRSDRTGAWWSAEAEKRVSEESPRTDWSSSPLVFRIINRRVAGTETRNWLGWLNEKYLEEPAALGLSIGCGTGLLERDALDQGLCRRMEGVDIAAGALEIARERAVGLPVTYRLLDLESDPLPPARYDIVFSAGALHHINQLDFCVEQLHGCLKEDGLLVINEYVGPCRFQWDARQLELVFEVYGFLPWRYRFNSLVPGTEPYPRPPEVCSMVINNPSEAVRSSEMLGVVERYFERIDRREIGGTLLNPILSGILENFDEDDELDRSFMGVVASLEEELIQGGFIASDFVVDVYRRRSALLGGEQAKKADRARSELVSDQESAIERALEGISKVRESMGALRERIDETSRKAFDAGVQASKLQRENASLKTGLVFSGVRALKSIAGVGTPVNEAAPDLEAVPPPSSLARVDTAFSMTTPETRAIKSYVEGIGRGNEIFWLRWLREAAGLTGGKALMVGLELSHAEVAVRLGVCGSVDIMDIPALKAGVRTTELYDIVFLDLTSAYESETILEPITGLLKEEGLLIVTADRVTECTRGFERAIAGEFVPQRVKGFGSVTGAALAEVLPQVLQRDELMAQALAGLLLYSELVRIEHGLLPPALELRIYRKGDRSSMEESAPRLERTDDIALLQEREIERLKRLAEKERLDERRLEKELEVELQNMERVADDLDWLRTERSLLEKRGPFKYVSILLVKRRWARSGGSES